MLGDALGLSLLDALRAEVEAEGADADPGLLEPDRDAGGVDAAREVEADLGLAVQAPGDGLRAALADRADRGRPVAERRVDRLAQREVRRDGEPAVRPSSATRPGSRRRTPRIGHVLAGDERERQVLVDRRPGRSRPAGRGWPGAASARWRSRRRRRARRSRASARRTGRGRASAGAARRPTRRPRRRRRARRGPRARAEALAQRGRRRGDRRREACRRRRPGGRRRDGCPATCRAARPTSGSRARRPAQAPTSVRSPR